MNFSVTQCKRVRYVFEKKNKHHQKQKSLVEKSVLTSTFVRIRDRLRSIALGITGSTEEAEDALHDAFCNLWRTYPGLDSEEEAARLTYTAVRNTALDLRRRNLTHPSVDVDVISQNLTEEDAEEENERKELCNALLDMASRVLKDSQYRIFIMHDVDSIAYSEIAVQLGMTEVNVRQQLSRARKTIREEYRKIRR